MVNISSRDNKRVGCCPSSKFPFKHGTSTMTHQNVRHKNSTFNVSIAYSEKHEKDREKKRQNKKCGKCSHTKV